jgi:hypothetical protein
MAATNPDPPVTAVLPYVSVAVTMWVDRPVANTRRRLAQQNRGLIANTPCESLNPCRFRSVESDTLSEMLAVAIVSPYGAELDRFTGQNTRPPLVVRSTI